MSKGDTVQAENGSWWVDTGCVGWCVPDGFTSIVHPAMLARLGVEGADYRWLLPTEGRMWLREACRRSIRRTELARRLRLVGEILAERAGAPIRRPWHTNPLSVVEVRHA